MKAKRGEVGESARGKLEESEILGVSGGRGRVLRVKQGYNPNSSSMGSLVFAFSAKILGFTALFGTVAGLIYASFVRRDTDEPGSVSSARESGRRRAGQGRTRTSTDGG